MKGQNCKIFCKLLKYTEFQPRGPIDVLIERSILNPCSNKCKIRPSVEWLKGEGQICCENVI